MRRFRQPHETRVSAAVREALAASGKSLRGFAADLGVSPPFLSDLSRGNRPLGSAMAARLARYKPKRSVRQWLLLQLDDDMDALVSERKRVANS